MMKIVRLYYVRVKFLNVRPSPGLLPSLFSLMESEISEKASRQVTTEEPSLGL